MKKEDAGILIEMLKSGMKYFKPLPYSDVEGGTTITYNAEKEVFVEEYLNRSLYDRGEEHFFTERTAEELMEMFEKEKYTDRHYPLFTASEDYHILLPGEEPASEIRSRFSLSDLHPNDMHMANCQHCRSVNVIILDYTSDVNVVTGDRYVTLSTKCNDCGKDTFYSWDD